MAYSFHAGGAANHAFFDPWPSGAGVLRDIVCRWSELDITRIGSLVAIAGTAPGAWRFVQRTWHEAYSWIRRLFLASVTIPGGDPLNRSVVQWMLANRPRHCRSFVGRTEVGRGGGGGDRAAALKKTQHPVRYSPRWDSRWLWYGGNVFIVTRASSPSGGGGGRGGGVAVAEEDEAADLTVSCFGWSAEPVKRLVAACREHAERRAQFFVIVYARDRYGLAWKPKARQLIRRLETVHLDGDLKRALLADVRSYLDPATQRLYQSRSMPYRRGYLFYGPPGTGKTSLSVAIAGEFGLDIYEVKVPSVAADADLEQMFQEIPPRCVVLLEDIDAVWAERPTDDKKTATSSGRREGGDGNVSGGLPSNCTLSGLLNVLDGVGSQEGRIVIMTTNRPERLDGALVRPGRVDLRVPLGNISRASAEEMFVRMFSPDLGRDTPFRDADEEAAETRELAARFAARIPEDAFTPSMLQGFFQLHLDSPRNALSSVDTWVERELAKISDRDFEVITGERK